MPLAKRCDKGNACYSCDLFARDRGSLPEHQQLLTDAQTLITASLQQEHSADAVRGRGVHGRARLPTRPCTSRTHPKGYPVTDSATRERQSQALRVAAQDAQHREAAHPTPDPPESDATAIVRVLTAKLKDERRRHREEVTSLRAELAATHGALLQQLRANATV